MRETVEAWNTRYEITLPETGIAPKYSHMELSRDFADL
jgi:hypothetical protein